MWGVYVSELEDGRADPLPEYVGWFAVANKLGIPVTEIGTVHPYWIRIASVMLEAEAIKADQDAAKSRA
jgi:hypothetical protein